jgi:MFS family permease
MYMNSTLLTNVTSLFDTTNLISILDTVLTILQAVLYPIYSKLSDMYGRAYLYTAAIILYMVSYIVFACSSSYQDLVVCILSKEKFLSLKHTYLGW